MMKVGRGSLTNKNPRQMKNGHVEVKTLTKDKESEVIVQKWEESERGWGTRPDGFSLHLTEADRETFIKQYWERMPDSTPHEYSRPDGKPYRALVDAEILARVKKSVNGIRSYDKLPILKH